MSNLLNVLTRIGDKAGSLGALGAAMGCSMCFPAIASLGAAIGVGSIVGNYLSGALRNPSAAAGQTAMLFIGIAFSEAFGIFSFLVALLLMFAV